MRTAGGSLAAASAATAAAGSAAAQEGGGGKTVEVGPGNNKFAPESIQVKPGTTVTWNWKSDNHNIVVSSQPSGANWQGTKGGKSKTYNTGHTYTHSFQTKGTYEYFCQPHKALGMTGSVEVTDNPSSGGGEKKLEEMGVPLQAHYVGSATILGMIATIIYSFFVLKYGESPNTGTGK